MKNQRQIKFRVWDEHNKQMVEWPEARQTELLDDSFDGKDAIAMQFIGRTDINGEDVYEGDIVRLGMLKTEDFDSPTYDFITTVEFHTLCYTRYTCVEIIGNIFENPELMKGTCGVA